MAPPPTLCVLFFAFFSFFETLCRTSPLSAAAQMGCALLFIRATQTLIWLCICSMCQIVMAGRGWVGQGGKEQVGGRGSGRLSYWPEHSKPAPRASTPQFLWPQCAFLLCMSVITSTVNLLALEGKHVHGWMRPGGCLIYRKETRSSDFGSFSQWRPSQFLKLGKVKTLLCS